LARRTRLRKKFFFESLQKEVIELQRENAVLKEIVKSNLEADDAQKVLEECNVGELPSVVTESCGEEGAVDLDQQDFNLVCSIKKSQQCFVITDPSLHDNPIVYASSDFLTLTGYSRDDVLGRNCRFLQGTDTSKEKVDIIRKGLAEGNDVGVCFINYTADGTAFWNKLFIAALRDTNNNIVNYIGVTVKVAGPAPDDPEAGKLLPGQKSQKETIPTPSLANDAANGNQALLETSFNVKQEPEFNDAEGTVMAMDEVVSAAVANAPTITPQCAVLPPAPQGAPPPPQCAPNSS
jgi:PAS domain S-box-containing protein